LLSVKGLNFNQSSNSCRHHCEFHLNTAIAQLPKECHIKVYLGSNGHHLPTTASGNVCRPQWWLRNGRAITVVSQSSLVTDDAFNHEMLQRIGAASVVFPRRVWPSTTTKSPLVLS